MFWAINISHLEYFTCHREKFKPEIDATMASINRYMITILWISNAILKDSPLQACRFWRFTWKQLIVFHFHSVERIKVECRIFFVPIRHEKDRLRWNAFISSVYGRGEICMLLIIRCSYSNSSFGKRFPFTSRRREIVSAFQNFKNFVGWYTRSLY